jgi:hypothetical protein
MTINSLPPATMPKTTTAMTSQLPVANPGPSKTPLWPSGTTSGRYITPDEKLKAFLRSITTLHYLP